MIGVRVGPVTGVRVGAALGVSTDQIGPNATAVLTVAINDSADPVLATGNFNYTVVVTNLGAATLAGVASQIILDASLTFVSGSGTGWTVVRVGQVVTATRATLATGAAPTITITVTAGASATTTSTTAGASATGAPNAASDTETTTIQVAGTTLTVAVNDSADPVSGSTNFNYTTVVTNTGAATATTVSCVITLDASLTFVSGSGTGWSVSAFGQTVTCTRATLAVGAAPTITVTVTAGSTGLTASTTADASAANALAAPQDTETTVIQATTLTVALTDATDPVITAVNFNYSHIVTNTGSNTAVNVSAPVVLDASLTFVSGSGTGWTVSHSAGTVTCTRATLAVGAAPTITIAVTTGGSALTASSNANAIAGNAPAATQSTQATVVKLVDRDATSLERFPSSATQWTDFRAYHVAIGTANFPNVSPGSLWLFQESSGNFADSIGSVTLTSTLTVYSATVSGYSRKGAGPADLSASTEKATNTTTAPNAGTTSTMLLAFVSLPTAPLAANRDLFGQNASAKIQFLTTGTLRIFTSAGTAFSNVSASTVQPIVCKVDLTGSTSKGYSSQEKVTATFATPVNTSLVNFGSLGSLNVPSLFLYAVEFSGASAEMTDANVKALLVAMGRSIPWT